MSVTKVTWRTLLTSYVRRAGSGARCCKRNAFWTHIYTVKFVNEKYGFEMESSVTSVSFHHTINNVQEASVLFIQFVG